MGEPLFSPVSQFLRDLELWLGTDNLLLRAGKGGGLLALGFQSLQCNTQLNPWL